MYRALRLGLPALAVWMASIHVLAAAEPAAGNQPPLETSPAEVSWHTSYAKAVQLAREQGKMLLIFFYKPAENRLREFFESTILTEPAVAEKLEDYVCAKLPIDVKIRVKGQKLLVLEHPSFKKMQGRQGVAILDFAHKEAGYYGCVVSTFAFTETHCYSARQMLMILDLPPGTPEQRMRSYIARSKAARSAAGGKAPIVKKEQPKAKHEPPVEISWYTDYTEAMNVANRQGKMLFIFFCDPGKSKPCNRFKAETLGDPMVRKKLQNYVCAQLPLDTKIVVDGKEVVLLEHASLKEMLGKPGAAIIDFAHRDTRLHGTVVSTFPITGKLWYTPERMAVILDLPPGTLTQRTLIYAVRIHPDKPASTEGQINSTLLKEAERHSTYQARIRLQGHHRWETRFHRINAKLPPRLTAVEVCAESWPGEKLVEAAIECVRCWRFSSGHWSAVRAWHRFYGYDMKRGTNGIWYATGIFGRG